MLRKTSSLLTISVMIILNAACTQLQVENSDNVIGTQIPPTPTPIQSIASSDEVNSTPTVESSPTSIATDLKNTSMNICFLYIVETEEQLGGMPSSFDSVYIHKDGTIQQTREKNDDTIQLLREGRVDTSDVLRDFSNIELPLLDIAEQENDGVTISEYSEPTVQIEFVLCNGSKVQWSAKLEDVPLELKEFTENIKSIANTFPAQQNTPENKYIRSQVLTSEKEDQLRRAELVVDINLDQLESSSLLQVAISFERRLIEISSPENLYGTIPLLFTYGRSGHIGYNQLVYQIRHLVFTQQ